MHDGDAIAAREYRRGLAFAAVSVLLVSVAQLALKLGVGHIAADALHEWRLLPGALATPMVLLPLAGGMACYGASVFCWLAALGRLPLNLAYPLLSLSYPLVYLGALLFPFFNETLNAQRFAGIALIMLGVALLMARRR
jgi:undecaprenyl phosphate-alpha-L-ara4N flippase subunit ArnF